MDRAQELDLRRYLRSQRELAERLIEAGSLSEVAPDFISTVAELLRWEAGALWELRESASELRFVSGWSVPDLDAESLWQASRELAVGPGVGPPGRVLAIAEFHTEAFTEQSDELIALLGGFGDQLATYVGRSRVEARLEAGEEFKAAILAA